MKLFYLPILMVFLVACPKSKPQSTFNPDPKERLSAEQLDDLSEKMRQILMEKLETDEHFIGLNSLQISEIKQSQDGTVGVDYDISFNTEALDTGRVTHDYKAHAVLEKGKERWNITKVEAKSQDSTFQQALSISGTAPKD